MTTFNLYPADLDKWMYQNSAHYTGEFIDGCLLDNFIVETKRGYAVFYEEYLNCWQSWYRNVSRSRLSDLKQVLSSERRTGNGPSHETISHSTKEQIMKKFELGIGYMGNGATCWNSAVEEHGDYQTVAHISVAGNIRWYIPIENIPGKELLQIERLADCHRARTEDTMNTIIGTQESFDRYLWKIADQLTYDQTKTLLDSLKKVSTLYDKKLILIKTAIQYL